MRIATRHLRTGLLSLLLVSATMLFGCAQTPPAPGPETRILAIDRQRLVAGDVRSNIMIRDGDVICASAAPLYELHELSPLRESDYRASGWTLRPGDIVEVSVYELLTPGVEHVQTVRIGERGDLRLSQVGLIRAAGLTRGGLVEAVEQKLETDGTLRDATVSAWLRSGYGRFTLRGIAVARTGPMPADTYALGQRDTRLLQAIHQIGGLPETHVYLYVVRPQPEPVFKPLPGPLSGELIAR